MSRNQRMSERSCASHLARYDEAAAAAPLDDDCEEQSISTALPKRQRGGRSKLKSQSSWSKPLDDVLDKHFSKFGLTLDRIEASVKRVPDGIEDAILQRAQQIQALQKQRDRARLRTIIARGKLSEIRRRVDHHSEARYMGLLEELSSEPSSEESDESDGTDGSMDEGSPNDCDESGQAPVAHTFDAHERYADNVGSLGIPYLTRGEERCLRAACRAYSRLVLDMRLSSAL